MAARGSLNAVLEFLPTTPSINSKHTSFNDIFRSSRLGTLYNLSKRDQLFYARHQQPFPKHQVISSFNAAHRRGEWGLKRPLPPVKDSHIVVNQLDTEERQTPYYFATEKPKFVKRIQEMSIVLEPVGKRPAREQEKLREQISRKPRSLLQDTHPQWNRSIGDEDGPRVLVLSSNKLRGYIDSISNRRNRNRFRDAQDRLQPKIIDQSSDGFSQLVQGYLDISLDAPPFKTHPTAGLTYAAKGFLPIPTAHQNDYRLWIGGSRLGRCVRIKGHVNELEGGAALINGMVARMKRGSMVVRDRKELIRLKVETAQINPFGRLEVTVSTPWSAGEYHRKDGMDVHSA
jgi:Mitochondrial ribosomal protein subunit